MNKIMKFASLLAAAVMLFACEEANTSGELKIVSDKDVSLRSDA